MVESLKSARLAHMTLLLICATVIVSVLARDSGAIYHSGSQELDRLRQLVVRDLPGSLKETIKEFPHFEEFEKAHGVRFVPALPDLGERTVAEIYQYLANDTRRAFHPRGDSLMQALDRAERLPQVSYLRKRLDQREPLLISIRTISHDEAELFAEIRSDGWPVERYRVGTVAGTLESLDGVTFRTLLVINNLLRFRDGRWTPLPDARAVWDEINGRNLFAALEYTRRRWEDSEKDVAVLGFSVPERAMLTILPTVVLLVLSYLLALVSHMISKRQKYREAIREFPWIVLFPGRLGWAASLVSFIVVPAAAGGLLIASALGGTGQDSPVIAATGIVSALSVYCGFLIHRQVKKLCEKAGEAAA